MSLELSVVIPAYNRAKALECTLHNLADALHKLPHEVIIVDDGSAEPLQKNIIVPDTLNVKFFEQENQGSAVARSNGILATKGHFVFLSDSDDLIDVDKLEKQIETLKKSKASITYTDQGIKKVADQFANIELVQKHDLAQKLTWQELLIETDLYSNNLMYDGEFLRTAILKPMIPPEKRFGLAGDYWVYYNLLRTSGEVVKTSDTRCYHCEHDDQITKHWEPLGFSGQVLCEALIDTLDQTENSEIISESLSRIIFQSWRKLPNEFVHDFMERKLASWNKLPQLPSEEYGGKMFCLLASLMGCVKAGQLLRLYQRPKYNRIRTLKETDLMESYQFHFPEDL